MENRNILGVVALTVVALLAISSVSAFGFPGFGQGISDDQKQEMIDNQDAVRNAVQNNDFDTWKSLMEERIAKMQAEITEDNFNQLIAKHNEMQDLREQREDLRDQIQEAISSGDYDLARELREQMQELRPEGMPEFGQMKGHMGGMRQGFGFGNSDSA